MGGLLSQLCNYMELYLGLVPERVMEHFERVCTHIRYVSWRNYDHEKRNWSSMNVFVSAQFADLPSLSVPAPWSSHICSQVCSLDLFRQKRRKGVCISWLCKH